MTTEDKKALVEADADGDEDSQDIFYVCRRVLGSVRAKLKTGEDVTEAEIEQLAFAEKIEDEEVMVPVDMRGAGDDFDDVEDMTKKLGAKGTAEAFVKAADYFEANKAKEPDDERPQPMTAKEWKQVLAEDGDEGEEEEMDEGDEEEEAELDDPEVEGGDGEPAPKKAKVG